MDENERDLELFLDTLNLTIEYREYFRKRNVTSLEDLQQLVALADYHATRDLDDFARKLADEQENLALSGFKTPLSLIQQRKIEIMIAKLGKEYPSPTRVDFEDGSYYLGTTLAHQQLSIKQQTQSLLSRFPFDSLLHSC